MKTTPLILGACTAVAIAGAAMGSAINTTPLSHGPREWLDSIPKHEAAFGPQSGIDRVTQTPTQYALDTPQGRFEVGELAMRGRFARRSELAARYDRDVPADPSLAEIERIERAALEPFPKPSSPVRVTGQPDKPADRPTDPVGESPMTLPAPAIADGTATTTHAAGEARMVRFAAGVQ
jgi:hypothetical protein